MAADHSGCSACGCRTPFSCSVCAKPLSGVSVALAPNAKHPLGAFSEAGEPLCHEHRLTRCHHCESLFPHHQMHRHVIGQHADRVLREGKPPRIEPVFAYFCRSCNGVADSSAEDARAQQPLVLGLAILVTAVALAAIILR